MLQHRISLRPLWVMALAALLPFAASAQTDQPIINLTGNAILKDIVSPDTLSYATLEARGSTAAITGRDEYGSNISLNVQPGMIIANGAMSSEIAVNYPYKEGETIRYSWRMRLPGFFQSDAPANRWWLVARWNDQANAHLGERPEDYLLFNPVLMFHYKQIEGKDLIGVSYGEPDTVNAGDFSIRRGGWVKFTVEVLWSRTDTGKARIFINDAKLPVRELSGPNMHGKNYNIFRIGSYRSSDIKTTAAIQFGDIKVEKVPDQTVSMVPGKISPAALAPAR